MSSQALLPPPSRDPAAVQVSTASHKSATWKGAQSPRARGGRMLRRSLTANGVASCEAQRRSQ
eukprot:683936-Pleurochrysis_carterae.AAC.5